MILVPFLLNANMLNLSGYEFRLPSSGWKVEQIKGKKNSSSPEECNNVKLSKATVHVLFIAWCFQAHEYYYYGQCGTGAVLILYRLLFSDNPGTLMVPQSVHGIIKLLIHVITSTAFYKRRDPVRLISNLPVNLKTAVTNLQQQPTCNSALPVAPPPLAISVQSPQSW